MSDNVNTTSVFNQIKATPGLLERYFSEHLGRTLVNDGTNTMACICPWHNEKTPSLKIFLDDTAEYDTFHCFGACDFGGSIIDAVMRQENLDYPLDAVEWLNDYYKLGISTSNQQHKDFKEQVAKAKKQLKIDQAEMDDPNSQVAAAAKTFLQNRGITEETWKHFGLSVNKKEGRLRIPIIERGGHPIAWSGRALKTTQKCPNCSEIVTAEQVFNQRAEKHTELGLEGKPSFSEHPEVLKAARTCPHCKQPALWVGLANQHPKYKDLKGYEKSENLYNFVGALKILRTQKEISQKQPILIMEGFGDVWACHQAGFGGAVAYNGSSLTTHQAHQVLEKNKKLERWVGLVPDMDATGASKVYKNIDTLKQADPSLDVRILYGIDKLKKPDGTPCKDIGEVTQYHGDKMVADLLQKNWYSSDEFKIRGIISSGWDKLQEIERITKVVSEATQTIHLDELVPVLAEHWGTKHSTVSTFIHNAKGDGTDLTETAKIISSIEDAQVAAEKYLEEGFVINTDYEPINDCLPGGGFRLGQLSMILGKSGTGKTTLIANMLWQFLRTQQLPCIFFSLEQPKAQVYITLVQVALGIPTREAEELIKAKDSKLEEVNKLFENLTIIDNVPEGQGDIIPMTPDRVKQLIYEVNLTRTGMGETVKVVAIDHLGLIKPDRDASQGVKDSDSAVSGYAMEKFYSICKQTQTFFMVLQQLPKEVAPGEEFSYDAGRGASQQTDFCDYIICIWRPDQAKGLSEDEKTSFEGQYKFKLGKNRHGANNVTAHLIFDHQKRRITSESAFGIPVDFMPQTDGIELADIPTGVPSGLFDSESEDTPLPDYFLQ